MGESVRELLSIISMTCLYDFIDFYHDLVCLWYQEIRGDKFNGCSNIFSGVFLKFEIPCLLRCELEVWHTRRRFSLLLSQDLTRTPSSGCCPPLAMGLLVLLHSNPATISLLLHGCVNDPRKVNHSARNLIPTIARNIDPKCCQCNLSSSSFALTLRTQRMWCRTSKGLREELRT